MKVDLKILDKYISEGWVVKSDHPSLPLSIYNYSRKTQYESMWDEITLMCRGLILDKNGILIAKSFNKFFNMEELKPEQIPNEPFEVFEKMDGSLGIFFNYKGEWIMATKGSFISDQSIVGLSLAKQYEFDKICVAGFTYIFEILYPENRIVVDYCDEERLVLLSVLNSEGIELSYDEIKLDGWDVVDRYNSTTDFKKLKQMIPNNKEGFVIRFRSGMRMKIKGEEYVRLHRILTQFSNVDIWEYLKDKKDLSKLLDRVPDEFDTWVRETVKDLVTRYENIEKEYKWIYEHIMSAEISSERKVFAELAKRYSHPSILFKLLDGGDYSTYIWKILRPKYSKPFWQKEIEE